MKKTAAPRRDRKDLLQESVQTLHRIFQAVDLFSRQTLRDFGVTGPQVWALRAISESGVMNMGEIAQRMHLHISTVTGIVARLEAGKLVTRERAASDGRIVEIRLTPRGRSILARSPEPPRSKAARGLSRLGSAELRRVHLSLLLIADAMDVDLYRGVDE